MSKPVFKKVADYVFYSCYAKTKKHSKIKTVTINNYGTNYEKMLDSIGDQIYDSRYVIVFYYNVNHKAPFGYYLQDLESKNRMFFLAS